MAICYNIWLGYHAKNLSKQSIVTHYDPPLNLSPLTMGTLWQNGRLRTQFITAQIIHFAVNGYLTIEDNIQKRLFGTKRSLSFVRTAKSPENLSYAEKQILRILFSGNISVDLSALKNNLSFTNSYISNKALDALQQAKLLNRTTIRIQNILIALSLVFAIITISAIVFAANLYINYHYALSSALTTTVLCIFALKIARRSEYGHKIYYQILGFRQFMLTAEKHRQIFNERRNYFEKLLPYAIMFGMTSLWISKLEQIYHKHQLSPTWLHGSAFTIANAASLNNFASEISKINNEISTSLSSSSHSSSRGGSAGGGGGGGGGGSW